MNAEEARKLTSDNKRGALITALMPKVFARIKRAASEGKNSITHPTYECLSVTYEQELAVHAELRRRGYEVIHHPDPDPGHPASRPYTEVKW